MVATHKSFKISVTNSLLKIKISRPNDTEYQRLQMSSSLQLLLTASPSTPLIHFPPIAINPGLIPQKSMTRKWRHNDVIKLSLSFLQNFKFFLTPS